METKKTYRSMTREEQKAYRHERYKTSAYEITLKLKDLTKEQQEALVAALTSFAEGK